MGDPKPNLAIETRDLRVDYDDVVAVAGIDLQVERGSVFGLVGPNGAGKSSTIRVLATLQEPTYGDVFIEGLDTAEDMPRVHRLLGYMPDLAPTIPDLRVGEFLTYFAAAYGFRGPDRKTRVNECLERVGMAEKRDALCKTLSRGMTQRVVLAKTLLHRPQVLLLDEPASGMDPLARLDLRDTLRALAADGATVLLSSHILTELADISTAVGIMHRGQLLACGPVDEVVAQWSNAQRAVTVKLLQASQTERAAAVLMGFDAVGEISTHETEISFTFNGETEDLAELLKALVDGGVAVIGFMEKGGSIENIMRAIGPAEGKASA